MLPFQLNRHACYVSLLCKQARASQAEAAAAEAETERREAARLAAEQQALQQRYAQERSREGGADRACRAGAKSAGGVVEQVIPLLSHFIYAANLLQLGCCSLRTSARSEPTYRSAAYPYGSPLSVSLPPYPAQASVDTLVLQSTEEHLSL